MKKTGRKGKKLFSMCLGLAMIFSLIPSFVHAEGTNDNTADNLETSEATDEDASLMADEGFTWKTDGYFYSSQEQTPTQNITISRPGNDPYGNPYYDSIRVTGNGTSIHTDGIYLFLHDKTNISQDVNVTNGGSVIISYANLVANNITTDQATNYGINYGIEIHDSVVTAKALNTDAKINIRESVVFAESFTSQIETEFFDSIIFIKNDEGNYDGVVYTPNDSIRLTPQLSFEIPEGATLTIPEGITLRIYEGATLTNNGNVIVNGPIENNGTIICNSHNGGTATCAEQAVCSLCGAKYGETLDHTFTTYKQNNDATCTKNGTKTAKCDYCDATDTIFIPNSMIEHTGELKNSRTATCTQTGYTGDTICKNCGETLKKGETIPMLSHSYKNGKCTVCGKSASNSPETTETEEPTDTEETTDTEVPTNTEKTTDTEDLTDTEAADITEKPKTNAPKTGDDTPIIPAAVMLIASLAVCGILIIKK